MTTRISARLPTDPGSPALARALAKQVDLDADTQHDLGLLLHEVVTNAVRHSGAGDDAPIEVEVVVEPACIHVEVADRGRGFAPVPGRDWGERQGGIGLYLVDVLSQRWGVESSNGARVWFDLERASTSVSSAR